MPHLVLLYTPNLEPDIGMSALCRSLADAMLAVRDEAGKQVFPTGGTRVLAYSATHHAVADGSGDHGFLYLNLRMGGGRTPATQQAAGDAVRDVVVRHCGPVLAKRRFGITVQVDESPGQVYDAKVGNLHPLFTK